MYSNWSEHWGRDASAHWMILAQADSAGPILNGSRPTTSMRPRRTTGLSCSPSCSRYAQLDNCLRGLVSEVRCGSEYGSASA